MTRTLMRTLVLLCTSVLAQADTLTPTSIQISDPAVTRGLTVLSARLPENLLLNANWRAVDASGAMVELQLLHDGLGPLLTGLLRRRETTSVALYADALAETPLHIVNLVPEQAEPGGAELLLGWAAARNARWSEATPGSLLANWRRLAARAYQLDEMYWPGRQGVDRSDLSAYSLFSGEAAIRETLQQQLIIPDQAQVGSDIPIGQLQGPTVASHPFAELLAGGAPGEDLALARLVPPARYFVYTDRPAGLLDWVDRGAKLTGQLAALGQRPLLDRQLLDRYLRRLGLNREVARRLSLLAAELALFGPDLYLAEGSTITLLVTVPATMEPLLNLLPGLPAEGEVLRTGEPAVHLARYGEILVLSTSAEEVDAVLQLARADGVGSLGDSAEFRYLLGQLPLDDSDELFVYLSDPFIRAMVGPRIKIAQQRRHQVRAQLDLLTAAALLYELDYGHTATLDVLLASGLISPEWLVLATGERLQLDQQGLASAPGYGSLAAMTPLDELAVELANPAEASAYQAYVDNYNRFWSRYFDPVAIRARIADTVHVDTLILPLIENSIYNSVRMAVGGAPVDLSPPAATPAPITVLSMRVGESLANNVGTLGPMAAGLGDHVHLALYDGKPIVTLGSSELLGMFGGLWLGGGDEFLWWGALASLLTQPAAVWVALGPQRSGDWLDGALAWVVSQFPDEMVHLNRIGDGADRVLSISVGGLIRFRLFLRPLEDYLVIANFRADHQLTSPAEPQIANAALGTAFHRIHELAPRLSLSRLEGLQVTTLANRDRLLPLMRLGIADPDAAMARHTELFGHAPRHPPEGHWVWYQATQELASSAFGVRESSRLPDPARVVPEPVGGLAELRLLFRFVDEGVRIGLQLR